MGAEQLKKGQRGLDYQILSEPETRLEVGRALLEEFVQESNLVTESRLRNDLFYQVRALKTGPIFPILVREDRETLADLSSSDFPMIIIAGGARALGEDVWVRAIREHGVEKVTDVVTRLPLYGFDGWPYCLNRDGFISTEICSPSLSACFGLKNGFLCFELGCAGVTSPYLIYRWVVNQEGAVLNEEARVHIGRLDMAEAVFQSEENGIFRIQASESSLVNSFTREDLRKAFDLFNLEGSDFLLSKQTRRRERLEESLTSLPPEWRFLLSSGVLADSPDALHVNRFNYGLKYTSDFGGGENLASLNMEMARGEGLEVGDWKRPESLGEAVAVVILFVDRQAVLEKGRLLPDDFTVCLVEKGWTRELPLVHSTVLTGHLEVDNTQGEKDYGDVVLNAAFQVVSGGGESEISVREVQRSDIHLADPLVDLAYQKPCLLHVCTLVLDLPNRKKTAFINEGLEENFYVESAISSILGLPVGITSGSRTAVRQAVKDILVRPEEFGFPRELIAIIPGQGPFQERTRFAFRETANKKL